MRTLKTSIFLPIAFMSLMTVLETGSRISVVIMLPLIAWLYLGIIYVAKEFPRQGIAEQYWRVWSWGLIFLYMKIFSCDKNIRYSVLLNEVEIGEISSDEYGVICKNEYSRLENLFDQINAILGSLILSTQILIAYTGGVMVWALIVSLYRDKKQTLNWLEKMYGSIEAVNIEMLLLAAALAVSVIAFRLTRNVYSESISNKLRIKFKQTTLGSINLKRVKS